jgi:hypothetical protein
LLKLEHTINLDNQATVLTFFGGFRLVIVIVLSGALGGVGSRGRRGVGVCNGSQRSRIGLGGIYYIVIVSSVTSVDLLAIE